MSTEYWHVLNAHNEDTDTYAHMIAGPTTKTADDRMKGGTTVRDLVIPNDMVGEFRYAATFDHHPTTEDLDALAPAGHRSWEQDQPDDDEYEDDGDDALYGDA